MLRLSCLLFVAFAAACGSTSLSPGPCDTVPPDPACNIDCDSTGANTCPIGFYCTQQNKCYAQCVLGGDQCGDGYACNADGQCVREDELPGGPGGGNCPRVSFTAKPTTPSIHLVIDRSGTMGRNNFGTESRWRAVRRALVDATTGIVTQLEGKAYFGALIYDTVGTVTCPRFSGVPRAINNADEIRASMAGDPRDDANTPTAQALDAMTASFTTAPAPADSPKIAVLATDGYPNNCAGVENRPESVAAARRAYQAGIKVIPLSVGPAISDDHLQDVANAGAGVAAGQPNAKFYKANDAAQLKAAFDAIIGGVVSCDLSLTGTVTDLQAQGGDVRLNDRRLTYGTDWQLVNGNTIRLLGAACTELKSTATPKVDGTFPCGTAVE